MALNFPVNPPVNTKYPAPPIPGLPVYTWDGQKWTTMGGAVIGGDVGTAPPGMQLPLMDGIADPGISVAYTREDHVHPSDTTRAPEAPADGVQYGRKDHTWTPIVGGGGSGSSAASDITYVPTGNVQSINVQAAITELDNEKVNKTGDTMSGSLTVPTLIANIATISTAQLGTATVAVDPSANMQVATKQYVDTKVGTGSGVPEAPTDGKQYGRQVSIWTETLPITGGTLTGTLNVHGDVLATGDIGCDDAMQALRFYHVTPSTPTNDAELVDSGHVNSLLANKVDEAPNDGQQYARQSAAWSVVTGGGGGGGVEEAPTDSVLYGRMDNTWIPVPGGASGTDYLPLTGGTVDGPTVINGDFTNRNGYFIYDGPKATFNGDAEFNGFTKANYGLEVYTASIYTQRGLNSDHHVTSGGIDLMEDFPNVVQASSDTEQSFLKVGESPSNSLSISYTPVVGTPSAGTASISMTGHPLTISAGALTFDTFGNGITSNDTVHIDGQPNYVNTFVKITKRKDFSAQIISTMEGAERWVIDLGNGTPETGGNTGSNFSLGYYSDFGAGPYLALLIDRASGLAMVKDDPVDDLGIATKQYVDTGNNATAVEYIANSAPTKKLTSGAVWSAANWILLTDAASATPDFSLGIDFQWSLGSAGGSVKTLNNPTNVKVGQKGIIFLVQDGVGNRTMPTFGANWKFSGGVKPTLSTVPNSVDVISYAVLLTSFIACTFTADFK